MLTGRLTSTRNISTSSVPTINPWFISGFVDGEGSFMVQIVKNNKLKTG